MGSIVPISGIDRLDISIFILSWWKSVENLLAYEVNEIDATKLKGNEDHFVDERRIINMVPKEAEVNNHGVPTAKVSL